MKMEFMEVEIGTVIIVTVSTATYNKILNLVTEEFSHWVDDLGPIEGLNDRRMLVNISRLIKDYKYHHSEGDNESLEHQRQLEEFKEIFIDIICGSNSFDFDSFLLVQICEDQSIE